jgi:hypothetical protein
MADIANALVNGSDLDVMTVKHLTADSGDIVQNHKCHKNRPRCLQAAYCGPTPFCFIIRPRRNGRVVEGGGLESR